jgi:hypothetical protein
MQDIIISKGTEEVKNMNKSIILGNQRGGVSVMVISLIGLMSCILIMVVCLDYIFLYNKTNKLKNDLNAAVHAASLSIDETQLSLGFFKLDTTTPGRRAQDMFYKYLQANMLLDANNNSLPGSRIKANTKVNIDELVYVDFETRTITNMNTKPTSCSIVISTATVSCNITLNAGTSTEITRTVNQTVIGPSVVAIVDTYHEGIGSLSNEPLLLPAVQEVYFRKN